MRALQSRCLLERDLGVDRLGRRHRSCLRLGLDEGSGDRPPTSATPVSYLGAESPYRREQDGADDSRTDEAQQEQGAERFGDLVLSLAALGAIGIALGTLVSLLYSEYAPLFGFMESGYRLAIVLTLVFDGLTTIFLGFFLLIVGPRVLVAITERRTG